MICKVNLVMRLQSDLMEILKDGIEAQLECTNLLNAEL